MSLVARCLEADGIATVVLGSALDIVEHCGVPRFAFADFPLGNPCGRPWDGVMQRQVVASAMALFETAAGPRTTARLPYRWGGDESWRDNYMAIREADLDVLRRQGDERRALRRKQAAGMQTPAHSAPMSFLTSR